MIAIESLHKIAESLGQHDKKAYHWGSTASSFPKCHRSANGTGVCLCVGHRIGRGGTALLSVGDRQLGSRASGSFRRTRSDKINASKNK